MDLTYRLATRDDLTRFYGAPQQSTIRAVTVLLEGRQVGVIGLEMLPNAAKLFSDYSPDLVPHIRRLPVMRAVKLAMKMVESCGRPVYAIMQDDSDMLPKLGFEHYQDEVYQWRGSQRHSLT